MSTIIETLKRKYNAKKIDEGFLRQDNYDSKTQELLAQTYLNSGTSKSSKTSHAKPWLKGLGPKVAIAASTALVCGAIIYLIAGGALNVSVTVIKRPHLLYTDLITKGELEPIRGAQVKRGYISLESNPLEMPASVAINPKELIDLTQKDLDVGARLKRGRGELRVILRDKNSRSYISDTMQIYDIKAGRRNLVITGDNPKESIDMRRIAQVRIEFYNSSAHAKGPSVIMLDKVILVENR
ncbi:MAG: hypothetical protein ABH875_06225 [Candidatus Omnitrophota bacterium]